MFVTSLTCDHNNFRITCPFDIVDFYLKVMATLWDGGSGISTPRPTRAEALVNLTCALVNL